MNDRKYPKRVKAQWSHVAISQMPKDIVGVYAFWCRSNGKCIYVGKAERRPIRTRLFEHWRGSHNEILRLWIREFGADLDICYMSVDPRRIDKLETRLIRLWCPEANGKGNPGR